MFQVLMVTAALGDDCVPVDPAEAARAARGLLFALEIPSAVERVQAADAGLGCLSTLTTPEALAALYQAGGAAAARDGRTELATEWFDTALRLAPHVSLDGNLGAGPLWTEAAVRAEARPVATVVARSEVRLDGWSLAAGAQRQVPEGWHLVQHLDASGRVVPERVTLAAGETLLVGPAGPTQPPPALRLPMVLGGAGLVLGGAVALVGALERKEAYHTLRESAEWDPEEGQRRASAANGLLALGSLSIVLGTASLVGAGLLFVDHQPVPAVSGRF